MGVLLKREVGMIWNYEVEDKKELGPEGIIFEGKKDWRKAILI